MIELYYGQLGVFDLVIQEYMNIFMDQIPAYIDRNPNPGITEAYLYQFADNIFTVDYEWCEVTEDMEPCYGY